MTPDERDQLIQRYFDGETLGDEVRLAERLLDEDPEAQAVLANLRTLSDSIKIDVAGALAEEDFSEYWANIADRLPVAPLSHSEEEREMVVVAAEPLTAPPSIWSRLLARPGTLALAAAAAVMAFALIPGGGEETGGMTQPVAVVDNSIVIEEIESPSSLVLVQQASDDEPAIIWVVEGEQAQEG